MDTSFWGDGLDDAITGTYYQGQAQALLDLVQTDWFDKVYASLNYFYDEKGWWSESRSYDAASFPNIPYSTGMLSSAIGQDYFSSINYLDIIPYTFFTV